MCMVMFGSSYVTVASKVSRHCGIQVIFYVKQVTLEPIYDSVFSLTYIFDMAPITFNAVAIKLLL